jgi:hypothetical protein
MAPYALRFNMAYFGYCSPRVKHPQRSPEYYEYYIDRFSDLSCGTPGCMAGHIAALEPDLYRSIRESLRECDDNARIAALIFERCTGKPCFLDFFGQNNPEVDEHMSGGLSRITRAETVAHIRGENAEWPQLSPYQCHELYE